MTVVPSGNHLGLCCLVHKIQFSAGHWKTSHCLSSNSKVQYLSNSLSFVAVLLCGNVSKQCTISELPRPDPRYVEVTERRADTAASLLEGATRGGGCNAHAHSRTVRSSAYMSANNLPRIKRGAWGQTRVCQKSC